LRCQKRKTILDKLKLLRDGYPYELTLYLTPSSEEDFLEVEARCLPVMHRKMGQGVQYAFPKSSVEDAQRLCKDFMKGTMCILNAKTITEPFVESTIFSIKKFEFLYNTSTQNQINKKAHILIEKAKKQILITGWIDREFLGDLENAKKRGVNVMMIYFFNSVNSLFLRIALIPVPVCYSNEHENGFL